LRLWRKRCKGAYGAPAHCCYTKNRRSLSMRHARIRTPSRWTGEARPLTGLELPNVYVFRWSQQRCWLPMVAWSFKHHRLGWHLFAASSQNPTTTKSDGRLGTIRVD
jgi:hypothetical protein